MSTMYKMIIPLLSDEFSNEDFSDNAGFCGIYSEDINRPYERNCIFLLYEFSKATVESYNRFVKFDKLPEIKNKRVVKIDNNLYWLYTIHILDSEVKRIQNGLGASNYKTSLKIAKFWNFKEGDINYMLSNKENVYNYAPSIVPEEDYEPTRKDLLSKKGLEVPFSEQPTL